MGACTKRPEGLSKFMAQIHIQSGMSSSGAHVVTALKGHLDLRHCSVVDSVVKCGAEIFVNTTAKCGSEQSAA